MKLKKGSLRKTKDVQNIALMAFWETDVSYYFHFLMYAQSFAAILGSIPVGWYPILL